MDDPGPSNLIFKLILLFALILVNAFFAMSEIAIISLNENKLRHMAEEGNKRARQLLTLTADSARFLSTIQVGVTLAGFLTSASAAENFSDPLAAELAGLFHITGGSGYAFISGLSLVLVTLIISFFSLVLGELVPKRIAMQRSEAVSLKVAGVLLFINRLMRPVVWLLSGTTNLVVRALGFDPHAEGDVVTEEEIRLMVDAGEEKGVIEESQKEMINNVFEFDDISAADVMTHRTDIEAVELEDSIEDVLKLSMEQGLSRIPVYREDLDDIVGILNVKDLLQFVGKPVPDTPLEKYMRRAHFVPETKRCGDLFAEMTAQKLQMVIVSDEYGGTAGIVTIEDLIESIVGNIQDEYDNEEEELTRVNETTFHIDGTMDIEEVDEALDITLPEGEYDTIGGLIMNELGRIPGEDEHPAIEICGYRFTVQSIDERRIEDVLVEKLPEPSAAGQEKSSLPEKAEKSDHKPERE